MVTIAALEEISCQYPLVQKILDWRALSQDYGFLLMAAQSDRLHPIWAQTRSGTSRIFARDPAVQNVSKARRHLFVPAVGYVLIKADYSQAQIRILAAISGDENLLQLFSEGADVHAETARWLSIDRDSAKQVNFGICFGISPSGLAGRINKVRQGQGLPFINTAGAQGYIDGFYDRYPKVREFFETEWQRLKAIPQSERLVRSLLGRIRKFDTRANPAVERRFRVTVPQQIEADLIKTAMVRLSRIFNRRKMGARIVMMIHDSLWVEAPEKEAGQVRHLMKRMMEMAGKPYLKVPLGVAFG